MDTSSVDSKIESYFSQFHHKTFKKGEIIIYPNDQPYGAFYIKKGYVRVYSISEQGIEMTVHIFVPRAFFPLTWIISDIKNRYYYEALTDVEAYSVPKETVNSFLKDNPDVLYYLTSRLLMGLDRLIERVEQLAFGKAHVKMISTLLYLGRHFGKKEGNKVTITEKFTHREIAAFAGMSRETASREWEKLNTRKLISHENQLIVINDLIKLQEELSK